MGPNVVIANEKAHWGLGSSKARKALDFLNKHGFPFSLSPTKYPGHARQLAATAAAHKVETVIVIGGDGTLNEVVNGLFASPGNHMPSIGIVPAGSSNDLSKSLGIPQNVTNACRTILDATVRYVDVGRAGPHYFCMASSVGLFAEIAARSLRMKGLAGSPRYTIAALAVISRMATGWEMDVIADAGRFRSTYGVLLVGNAPRFGGLTMLPGALLDDGVLDCLLIETTGRLQALNLLRLVHAGALERHKKVTRFQTKSLSVSLTPAAPLCNDGQVYPDPVQKIEYSVLPRKLPVICRARQ
jgi:diacylglycerol kinase (ATP)